MKPFFKNQHHDAVVISKKLILLALFIALHTVMTQAQSAEWMLGKWNSRNETTTAAGSVTSTIRINDVSGAGFTGTKTSELNNGSKITIAISGSFRARLYIQNGEVLRKEPANAEWYDCSACGQASKMMIRRDSILLITSIANCDSRCDAETFYYRLLKEFDSSTQVYLVNRFGLPSNILAFRPFVQQKPAKDTSRESSEPLKNEVAAAAVASNEKRLQHINDSIRNAQQKKRQQAITDSLSIAQQKQKQRLKDSLDNVARLEQLKQRTEDSLRDAQAKKRQQEITDSLSLVQQKEQQRIKDSLADEARLRQQQINDSTLLAQQKKREQEIADSVNIAKQKEQQRISDSLADVARLQQMKQRTEDSLRDVQVKKRQQEVADSISLAQQKEKLRISDSLQNVAAANLQKQRTEDSLRDAKAAKRQLEIIDSLAAVRKQQYDDSLQKAALAKAVPPADEVLTSRTSVLLGTYHIASPDILIELFDNGEIDGDIVSVYHNDSMIVSNQTLGTKAITLNIHADATNRQHEFVMVAENLGSIPPNSALMRVTAGKQIYKLSVNTDLKTNARIVFIYDGN